MRREVPTVESKLMDERRELLYAHRAVVLSGIRLCIQFTTGIVSRDDEIHELLRPMEPTMSASQRQNMAIYTSACKTPCVSDAYINRYIFLRKALYES